MSDKDGHGAVLPTAMVEIKSKLQLEFRRISVPRSEVERLSLESFFRLVTDAHCLPPAAHVRISYQDPRTMRLTDLERAADLAAALRGAAPLLRLFVSRLRGVEVEVSGDEDEFDGSGDNCRENGRGRTGNGGFGRGGTGGGRGGTGGGRGGGSRGSEDGGRVSSVGDKNRQTRANDHLFDVASGTQNHFPVTTEGVDADYYTHTKAEEEDSTQTHNLEPCCSNGLDRAHDWCGVTDREGEDGIPEHPLITFYLKQNHGELGSSRKPGRKENLYPGTRDTLPDKMDRLSLSNNMEQISRNQHLANSDQNLLFVIEIYGFSPSLSTTDILQEFQDYKRSEYCIKWVDSTHALGIFASEKQAWLASGAVYKRFRTRMVREGTPESIALAEKLGHELRPQRLGSTSEERPKTTAMVARRMVSSALGIRVKLSQEKRQKEMRELENAREERRLKN